MVTQHELDEERWSRYMAAAHTGDGRLYELLLREIAAAIEGYVRRRFGRLSFTEDCVQECLLAIHMGRHTYDPRRPFRPWLFTIVRNKTIDLLRRAAAAPEHAGAQQPERYEADPADELAATEVLSALTPQYRDALALTKIAGYSTSQAAARIGISETAMRTRVSRALRATAALLRKERDYP